MTFNKNKYTTNDQIIDLFKTTKFIEEDDDNSVKIDKIDTLSINQIGSNIRKNNTIELSDLYAKYTGKVTSRNEMKCNFESDQSVTNESEEEECWTDNLMAYDLSQFKKENIIKEQVECENHIDVVTVNNTNNLDIQRGMCVQNQLRIWESLLEIRIKTQKMLITANSFPCYDNFLKLSESNLKFQETTQSTCESIYNLIDNLLILQSKLSQNFKESKPLLKDEIKRKDNIGHESIKRSKIAAYGDRIENSYDKYKISKNQILQKWYDRTRNFKDSQNLINFKSKIENALLNKNEMVRKTQTYRGGYMLFKNRDNNSDKEIILAEIFDDSDFYHQLLRELIEYKSNAEESKSKISQKIIKLQSFRKNIKRKIEMRASKGRKIRYNVHNKLINFMPAKDDSFSKDATNELFNSLFENSLS